LFACRFAQTKANFFHTEMEKKIARFRFATFALLRFLREQVRDVEEFVDDFHENEKNLSIFHVNTTERKKKRDENSVSQLVLPPPFIVSSQLRAVARRVPSE